MSNLKQKSVDGVIWTLAEKFGIQFIKMILGIILARLLTPDDYGLIGMITVFFVISNVFIDSGFGLAYIQKKDASDDDASTIFYFNLAISTFFYAILWFSAPLIAEFYNQEQLVELTRIMSLILIINSFAIIQVSKLTKDVDFRKKTIIMLVSALLSGGAGITAALNGYGVWSLVIQGITSAFIKTTGLWIFYKWRPRFLFNIDSLKSMYSFSLWALSTNIVRVLFDNIYILVIGKFFPAAQLGFYTKAKQFQTMVSKQSSIAVGAVAFPVFSKLQTDSIKLKNAMAKFSQHALFFIAPISAILIVIAKPLFLVLLTEKWLPMVPYFQLLIVAGFLYPLHMVNVQVLSAQGKVNLTFRIEVIKNLFRVVNIVIMYRYGVIYIIIGEIILSFIALVINTYYTKKFVNYGIFEQIKDIAIIVLNAIIIALIGYFLFDLLSNPYLKIVLNGVILGGLYLILMNFTNKNLTNSVMNILRAKIPKQKKV